MNWKVILYAATVSVVVIFIMLIGINIASAPGASSHVETINEINTPLATTTQASTVTTDDPNAPSEIYIGTNGGGIQVYSEATHDERTLVNSTEELEGIAYDWANSALYYSSHTKIYRINPHDSPIQSPTAVFTTTDARNICGLAMDWITGNIYAVGSRGYIHVCATTARDQGPSLKCVVIGGGYGWLNAVALDPIHGAMYITTYQPGTIKKMMMDGTHGIEIVRGLNLPRGIAIDYSSSRLIWADQNTYKVQSSNLDGSNLQTVETFSTDMPPYGVTLTHENIYVGELESLQVISKYNYSTTAFWSTYRRRKHLASTSVANLPRTRRNDCEGQICSGVCVLTQTSYRCFT